MRYAQDLSGYRIAIYARFSTDKQNERSVDDQIRECKEYIRRAGGDPSRALVFEDRAESGTSLQRSGGIEGLIEAARKRDVNAIVVEHADRISRDIADGMGLWRRWEFDGVRLIGITDGLDSEHAASKPLYVLNLLRAEMYVDDLRLKTRRGLIGRAHAGLCTGLLPYGYESEPDPASGGKIILVHEERALVVRRIFRECAEGRTMSGIARRLTRDDIAPPRGNGNRTRGGWVLNGVRAILQNPKYIGQWRYNQREFRKAPGENRRLPRKKSEADVITKDRPDLRIVSDDLWAAVQERFADNRARYGGEKRKAKARAKRSSFGRAGRPTHYLLSGLLVCGACGAPMTIHGSGEGRAYYRCDDAVKRGRCDNHLSVREAIAREVILTGIRDTLASSDTIAYARRRIVEKLAELSRGGDATTRQLRKRLAESERRIENLTNAVAEGAAPGVLIEKLRAEEEAAKTIRAELAIAEAASTTPVPLPSPDELVRAVFDLDRLLRDDVEAGREVLRRLLRGGTIRLVPGEDRVYTANAEILPFGLALGAPDATTPASGVLGGRSSTTGGCGDRI